jgi:hypothetical protein
MPLPARVYHFSDPMAVSLGLAALRDRGLTTRGVLFIALDSRGEAHLAVPESLANVARIKVGDKLSLEPPFHGAPGERYYHFDAIHRLPGHSVLWNGDRRLAQPGSACETAFAVSEWLKGSGARNMFLGCTPHQPGSWWAPSSIAPAVALHDRGLVDVVTTQTGLLARRQGEPVLYYLSYPKLALLGPLEGWVPVFESPLGNLLLLERRVLADRLVLTCQRGLCEVQVAELPTVRATAFVELASGFGVVGRVDGGAFAVTCGTIEDWGLVNVAPALLVGAQGDTLLDLARSLAARGGSA